MSLFGQILRGTLNFTLSKTPTPINTHSYFLTANKVTMSTISHQPEVTVKPVHHLSYYFRRATHSIPPLVLP